MGVIRSARRGRHYSLPAMRFLQYRVSADDPKIFDAGAGRTLLCDQNHSQRILLPGLSLHLEQRGRADHWPALAPILPRGRESDLIFAGSLLEIGRIHDKIIARA